MATIVMADDHQLMRSGLASAINCFEGFRVTGQVSDGAAFMELVKKEGPPDILLLDLRMGGINGYQTAAWVQKYYPSIRVLIFSVYPIYDSEPLMAHLLSTGIRGFIPKHAHPDEMKTALLCMIQEDDDKAFYFGEHTGKVMKMFRHFKEEGTAGKALLTEREIAFIIHACSNCSYSEIARKMNLGLRTLQVTRDRVFEKLGVHERVELAVYALTKGLIDL